MRCHPTNEFLLCGCSGASDTQAAESLAYLFKVNEGAAIGVDPGFFNQSARLSAVLQELPTEPLPSAAAASASASSSTTASSPGGGNGGDGGGAGGGEGWNAHHEYSVFVSQFSGDAASQFSRGS